MNWFQYIWICFCGFNVVWIWAACEDGWLEYNQYCLKEVHGLDNGKYLNWKDAKNECSKLNSNLLFIDSIEMNQFIANKYFQNDNTSIWLELNRLEDGVNFEWISGQGLNFVAWGLNQPDNTNGYEGCVQVQVKEEGTYWYDVSCGEEGRIVCSKESQLLRRPVMKEKSISCPSGWISYQEIMCLKLLQLQYTWFDGKAACASEGGFLPTITDGTMQDFINVNFLPSVPSYIWLGYNGVQTGTYRWDFGISSYTHWSGSNPSNTDGVEACASIGKGYGGYWNDLTCTSTANVLCANYPTQIQTASPTSQNICPSGWYSYQGTTCLKLLPQKYNWFDAKTACSQDGAYLLTITDGTMQNFVNWNFLSLAGSDIWIGYNRLSGSYQWDYGVSSYTHWAGSQPSNSGGIEACASIGKGYGGYWNDQTCSTINYVVCFLDTIPTMIPTSRPTTLPTSEPTSTPSFLPTVPPSIVPTSPPTSVPTVIPTFEPTRPTFVPTTLPTNSPTAIPSAPPTEVPTYIPTSTPTNVPSHVPTEQPTMIPTTQPSRPTFVPTESPTAAPSESPTSIPTEFPTLSPTHAPTTECQNCDINQICINIHCVDILSNGCYKTYPIPCCYDDYCCREQSEQECPADSIIRADISSSGARGGSSADGNTVIIIVVPICVVVLLIVAILLYCYCGKSTNVTTKEIEYNSIPPSANNPNSNPPRNAPPNAHFIEAVAVPVGNIYGIQATNSKVDTASRKKQQYTIVQASQVEEKI